MSGVLEWLSALPAPALYTALVVTAALENFFPPLPADTIVAFGVFLAARGEATAVGAFVATWAGNVAGAMAVYALGRRYGAEAVERRIFAYGKVGEKAENRLEKLYVRYGMLALFLSRFLPGVRALVPPFAGAMKMPVAPVLAAIAIASGIWYGVVTLAAYHVGTDWEVLRARLVEVSRTTTLVAGTVLTLIVAGWFIYRAVRKR
ncbi:MAG TPA: DedA family protein [Gemmatimonadaceae bacterium]|nr:DedA family protein [Gemmatimonadaceae bacterium]